jgi:hypothetical protein
MPEELREDYIIRINKLGKLYLIIIILWFHYFNNLINQREYCFIEY